MTDPLKSARLKIRRAEHHIEDLERRVIAFDSKDSYEIVIEADTEAGYKAHKFRLRRPEMIDECSLVTGDAVGNLRAALDHVIYACTIANGHTNPPIGACQFPFGGNDQTSFDAKVQGRAAFVPKQIQTLLREFRAYKGGSSELWALNEVCNRDKHALIISVLVGFNQLNVKYSEGTILSPANPWWDSAKNQVELFRAKGDPKYDFSISIDVAFDRPDCIAGHRVTAVLRGFLAMVGSMVRTIEIEAGRIGLL
ncbi:MAG TPA: hypothetical protein VMB85_09555 [Bryobacteraceae bacterium]|nr:hypothetical protein [Bryobacteraceae bacterium]